MDKDAARVDTGPAHMQCVCVCVCAYQCCCLCVVTRIQSDVYLSKLVLDDVMMLMSGDSGEQMVSCPSVPVNLIRGDHF